VTIEQSIAGKVGEAVCRHRMIKDKDKILIAFSGGKDSYTLVDMLLRLQRKAPVRFELLPVFVDSGFGADISGAQKYLKSLGLNLGVIKTDIAGILTRKAKGTSDTGKRCALCARLRRGVLYRITRENNCNKIALGHNLNDGIETFLLNILYASSADVMRPRYLAEDGMTTIIRPLISVPEELIIRYSKEKRFPIVKQECKYKKTDSKRAKLKKIVKSLAAENAYMYSSLRNSLDSLLKKGNK
jgi:tRNA 2-thiocytidine biosynthesis protein TtcA